MAKVLCIEDQADLREDLAEELRSADYVVIEAQNGREGLEAIKEHHPDLILCDVDMPEMDGRELLRELRQNHHDFANVPFIFLTALGSRTDVIDGKNLGADDYLTKPIDFDLLLATVRARLKQIERVKESNLKQARIQDDAFKLAKATIYKYAQFDAVTGLPNRAQLHALLKKALAGAKTASRMAALVFLELEQFTSINNRYGYRVGDMVLKEIAGRLLDDLEHSGDKFAVDVHLPVAANFGGISFGIMLPSIEDAATLSEYVEHTQALLARPVSVNGCEVFVNANLGVARFPRDGANEVELQRAAGIALQSAKEDGHGAYRCYDPALNAEFQSRAELEQDLHNALKREEFALHYQPQADMLSGKIVGAEALLRWHHPEHGLIPPDKFIPLAEATGIIVPLTEWVLETACRQARNWGEAGLNKLRMSVNLSPEHLKQPGFVESVGKIIQDSGIDVSLLELEITESAIVGEGGPELESLLKVHDQGISLSIDDFGTGYSSLSYLKRIPFDSLKIDKSFVWGMETDSRDHAIIEAIARIALCHGLKLIAEGVETEDQYRRLKQCGCDLLQGYWFSRPLPPEEFLAFAIRHKASGDGFKPEEMETTLLKGRVLAPVFRSTALISDDFEKNL